MDGYHYDNDYLESHTIVLNEKEYPLKNFKGTPATFNSNQFSKDIHSLQDLKSSSLSFPVFSF